MLADMPLIVDAFWRAVVYCFHPRVVALSLLPLVLMAAMAVALGLWYWSDAVAWVGEWLDARAWLGAALGWLESLSFGLLAPGSLREVLAPLVVLAVATPLVVVAALLLVGLVMTPAMVELVARRRFPDLQRKRGASWLGSLWWSAASSVMALLAMLASLPLWLIPPLMLVLPPLIWGWLTYRVFAFDALADHASAAERRALLAAHRLPLLVAGVVSGYLGALPGVFWASGAFFVALAPLLIPAAMWLYTLVFAFSSLWFTHYALAALQQLRAAEAAAAAAPAAQPAEGSAAPAQAGPQGQTDPVAALPAPPDVPQLPRQ